MPARSRARTSSSARPGADQRRLGCSAQIAGHSRRRECRCLRDALFRHRQDGAQSPDPRQEAPRLLQRRLPGRAAQPAALPAGNQGLQRPARDFAGSGDGDAAHARRHAHPAPRRLAGRQRHAGTALTRRQCRPWQPAHGLRAHLRRRLLPDLLGRDSARFPARPEGLRDDVPANGDPAFSTSP